MIVFQDSYQNNSPKPVDNKYGRFTGGSFRPYTDVAEANATINTSYRYKGLTVLIGDGTTNHEYWYFNSVADNGLVPKISDIDIDNVAYVEATGNNSTAQLSKPGLPFLTLNAALDALPAGGGIIKLGVGDFAAPDKTKIKNNTAFIGSGKALPNWSISVPSYGNDARTAPTKLVGGTVIKGPLDFSLKDGIIVYDLGVDSGSEWCAAFNSGNGENGIVCGQAYNLGGGQSSSDGLHTLQSQSRPRFGIVIRNVSALCKDSTTPFHAAIFENLYNVDVSGVTTYFGLHGIVFKGITGVATNLQAYGHSNEGLIIKSNDYANSYNLVVTNVSVSDINGVGGGIILENDVSSPILYGVQLANFNVMHTTFGVRTLGSLDNCLISTGIISSIAGNGFESLQGLENSSIRNMQIRDCSGVGFTLTTGTLVSRRNAISGIMAVQNTGGNFKLSSSLRLDFTDIYSYLGGGFGFDFGANVYGTGLKNIGTTVSGSYIETGTSIKTFTPTSTSDASGAVGDITKDDYFVYEKTNLGWKRATLNEYATASYHLSFFNALNGTALSAYTPNIGNAFTLFDGSWQIQNNLAVPSGSIPGSTQWVALTNVTGKTDVRLTMVATVYNNAYKQIWLRASAATGSINAIIVAITQDSVSRIPYITIYNVVSGVTTAVVTDVVAGPPQAAGSPFTVEVLLIGNVITVKNEHVAYVSNLTLPTTQTNTKYGFATANTSLATDLAVFALDVADAKANDANGATIRTINANYTVLPTDNTIIADDTAGNITITLPLSARVANKILNIKKIGATNSTTVDGNGSEAIDGVSVKVLSKQNQAVSLQAYNDAWDIVSEFGAPANTALAIDPQTATSYTFALSDASLLKTFSNASAQTATVPPNSTVPFSIGTQINVSNTGVGQVSFVAGGGVTINSANAALKLRVQHSMGTLIKIATDTWILTGDITT